ncbi:plasmid mobilization protein [Roseibium sp.]|uniref:plasmid mobilization protein n=1 Tax=Roseibium sp. TaxID=1936156 RepID=UPI003A969466
MTDHAEPVKSNTRRRRSEVRRRTSSVSARLLPSERAAIEACAEAAGCGVGTWSREVLTRAAGQPVPARQAARTDLARAVGRWTGEVGKLGNNLNQLSRNAHQGGRVDSTALNGLTAAIRDLHAAVTAYEVDGGNKARLE